MNTLLNPDLNYWDPLHTCHAPYNLRKVVFTIFWVLSCVSLENTLYITKTKAAFCNISGNAASGVVVIFGIEFWSVRVHKGYV